MIGKTLGHYRVLEPLGAGGMGDVYLGEDTRLGRKVAIKVLPEQYASDPERLARFEQEARAAAALNRPHIAVVYDVGFVPPHTDESTLDGVAERSATPAIAAAGTHFIVQEYLQGGTLRESLRAGAMPSKRALQIAVEVAEALLAAHAAGIVHRDLKPENIFITMEGHAKVLDFGLAKLIEGTSPDGSRLSISPTLMGTAAGQVMGTAGYMAPEQVNGEDVDARADLFAFGCVLYEMSTGRQPFSGKNLPEILHRIANTDPEPIGTIDSRLPAELQRIVGKCLAKDPGERFQHADDLLVDLRGLRRAVESGAALIPAPSQQAVDEKHGARLGQTVSLTTAGVCAVVLASVAAVGGWILASVGVPPAEPIYLSFDLPEGMWLTGGNPNEARIGGDRPSRRAIAVSPDGRTFVYAATDGKTSSLFRHGLDGAPPSRIVGTEGGADPFYSPAGDEVGFFAEGAMKAIALDGSGSPRTIASVGGQSASWVADTIVFDAAGGIHRVDARGGVPTLVTEQDPGAGEYDHDAPWLLPNASALLYTVAETAVTPFEGGTFAKPLGRPASFLISGTDAGYVPTGHLVVAQAGKLVAARFDPETLEVTSQPVQVIEDVMHALRGVNSALNTSKAQFAFSGSGTLAFVRGGMYDTARVQPLWVGRDGVEDAPLRIPVADYYYPRLSPGEQRRVAVEVGSGSDWDVQVFELATGARILDPMPGYQGTPVWSPDGARLAFTSEHQGFPGIYTRAADGSDDPTLVARFDGFLADWSVNDVLLLVSESDLYVMEMGIDVEPRVFVAEEGVTEQWPRFSPDGEWIAYAADSSGQFEVYVRPYPGGLPVSPVTGGLGGTRPLWQQDETTTRLCYRSEDGGLRKLMDVSLTFSDRDAVSASQPRELFDDPYARTNPIATYDVAADGRFLMVPNFTHATTRVTRVNVILHWFEELKRRVPVGR